MGKGAETRERILVTALRHAARDGLVGMSIGGLAEELGVSKSGLWAHFGSKEELQLEILRVASVAFEDTVVKPAVRAPRGLPRLRKLFEGWLHWLDNPATPGGCVFVAAATELDDLPAGRPRDYLVAAQRQLDATVARVARGAIEEGHFRRDLDCDQLAFEMRAILLGYANYLRLMRDPSAGSRARAAFDRLVAEASAR